MKAPPIGGKSKIALSEQKVTLGCRRHSKLEKGSVWNTRSTRYKQKSPNSDWSPGIRRTAATYSPTWWGSTIGDGELNFSVRNGKRWFLTAIATAVYYLRE